MVRLFYYYSFKLAEGACLNNAEMKKLPSWSYSIIKRII